MTVTTRPFARDFSQSRDRFLAAASRAGARIMSIAHPLKGSAGENLATDVARIGPDDADHLVVLVTGVHGVEHYAGSACVCDWLERGGAVSLPDGMAMVVIHAINPWGASYCRRYTEDNVDLARNFLDPSEPMPENPAYEVLHDDLMGLAAGEAAGVVSRLYEKLGEREAIESLMGGQYRHPEGFSFGGHQPTWAHQTVKTILLDQARAAKQVCIVEFHSGLGPWGEVIPVSMHQGADLDRVKRYFGDNIIAPRAEKGSHSASGHTTDGYVQVLEDRTLTSIVVEFGTYPAVTSLPVLLEDHRVHANGLERTEAGRAVALANLEMHCPQDSDWQELVLLRGARIIDAAIRGLSQCN
ncbi:MAG: DUF2817 domain-containing protein [Novosphingobium sp.]